MLIKRQLVNAAVALMFGMCTSNKKIGIRQYNDLETPFLSVHWVKSLKTSLYKKNQSFNQNADVQFFWQSNSWWM